MENNILQGTFIWVSLVIAVLMFIYVAKKLRGNPSSTKETNMSSDKVWMPHELQSLLEDVMSCTGGYPPIFSIVPDDSTTIPSSLHVPTLYPRQTVPRTAAGNWGSVARGLFNHVRALKGIPELKSIGDARSQEIARSLNEEIETLAATKTGVQPEPRPADFDTGEKKYEYPRMRRWSIFSSFSIVASFSLRIDVALGLTPFSSFSTSGSWSSFSG